MNRLINSILVSLLGLSLGSLLGYYFSNSITDIFIKFLLYFI